MTPSAPTPAPAEPPRQPRRQLHENALSTPKSTFRAAHARQAPRRAVQPTKQQQEVEWPISCLFERAEPFKTTFEHIQANVGPIAALNKAGLMSMHRMLGALGRVSDQKPIITHRRQAFIPGIYNAYIPRAAQMSEHRGAQS